LQRVLDRREHVATIWFYIIHRRRDTEPRRSQAPRTSEIRMVEGKEVPSDLKYTKDHEWLRVEDTLCRVGITDYAQNSLHEIVYADLPQVGRKLAQKESFGTVESVKAVSEVYSPISGEVAEVNQRLADAPELVNKQPYGDGWLILMKASRLKEEADSLMSAKEYEQYIKRLAEEK
jgi:glycine cleavage system H protein